MQRNEMIFLAMDRALRYFCHKLIAYRDRTRLRPFKISLVRFWAIISTKPRCRTRLQLQLADNFARDNRYEKFSVACSCGSVSQARASDR
jgi:hypothetical protein